MSTRRVRPRPPACGARGRRPAPLAAVGLTPTLPLGSPAATNPIAGFLRRERDRGGRRHGLECFNCGAPRFIVAGTLVQTGVTPAIAQVNAIEFHHAAFDHYFLSVDPAEIDALDTGYFTGWTRTGQSIRVFVAGSYNDAPVRPVCRHYGLPSAGLDSHFRPAPPGSRGRLPRVEQQRRERHQRHHAPPRTEGRTDDDAHPGRAARQYSP
jgi:hypothetical protein